MHVFIQRFQTYYDRPVSLKRLAMGHRHMVMLFAPVPPQGPHADRSRHLDLSSAGWLKTRARCSTHAFCLFHQQMTQRLSAFLFQDASRCIAVQDSENDRFAVITCFGSLAAASATPTQRKCLLLCVWDAILLAYSRAHPAAACMTPSSNTIAPKLHLSTVRVRAMQHFCSARILTPGIAHPQ